MAGLVYQQENSANYLYTNQNWWSLSPDVLYYTGYVHVWYVNSVGWLTSFYVTDAHGVRPAVSIDYDIPVTGEGTEINPYIAVVD
ncbi:MAG: DUF6273 domain-containing protein [Bacilli bacterium]|nr:DUF6273 domain-containing protein [Bacilli bacterium]